MTPVNNKELSKKELIQWIIDNAPKHGIRTRFSESFLTKQPKNHLLSFVNHLKFTTIDRSGICYEDLVFIKQDEGVFNVVRSDTTPLPYSNINDQCVIKRHHTITLSARTSKRSRYKAIAPVEQGTWATLIIDCCNKIRFDETRTRMKNIGFIDKYGGVACKEIGEKGYESAHRPYILVFEVQGVNVTYRTLKDGLKKIKSCETGSYNDTVICRIKEKQAEAWEKIRKEQESEYPSSSGTSDIPELLKNFLPSDDEVYPKGGHTKI